MSFTQSALILLVVFWSLQVAASWVQWSHYRRALTDATTASPDGYLGMGQHRPRLGLGAIALLEAAPDGSVRRLRVMSGWSIFSRFRALGDVVGWELSRLASHYAPGVRDDRVARSIRQAIAQVEGVRQKQRQPAALA